MDDHKSNPSNNDDQNKKEGDAPTEQAVPRDTSLPNDLTPLHAGQEQARKKGSKLRDLLVGSAISGATREGLSQLIDHFTDM
ncbi:hypothetical protein ITJ42_16045 [Clavibacter michiganensis subsp. phaseoli]|uniref:Uncharacterized protein n=1 Tax=Clavibacter phaseoli TaxID=1734031 RepID=A0A8I0VDP1_9MICO|nr:hypothetical protein [Clavibacter phaseoli]MBF4632732.1 hypothetical protein [Clavibacter phaseoli]